MPLYMIQFSYTNEAWAAQVKNPADRSTIIKELIEKSGGRMIGWYYCLGDYDAVSISEFPDYTDAKAVFVTVMGPGNLKGAKTTALYDVKQGMEAMAKAAKMTLQALPK